MLTMTEADMRVDVLCTQAAAGAEHTAGICSSRRMPTALGQQWLRTTCSRQCGRSRQAHQVLSCPVLVHGVGQD